MDHYIYIYLIVLDIWMSPIIYMLLHSHHPLALEFPRIFKYLRFRFVLKVCTRFLDFLTDF